MYTCIDESVYIVNGAMHRCIEIRGLHDERYWGQSSWLVAKHGNILTYE